LSCSFCSSDSSSLPHQRKDPWRQDFPYDTLNDTKTVFWVTLTLKRFLKWILGCLETKSYANSSLWSLDDPSVIVISQLFLFFPCNQRKMCHEVWLTFRCESFLFTFFSSSFFSSWSSCHPFPSKKTCHFHLLSFLFLWCQSSDCDDVGDFVFAEPLFFICLTQYLCVISKRCFNRLERQMREEFARWWWLKWVHVIREQEAILEFVPLLDNPCSLR
jgi:hypothetical protein